MRIVMVGGGGHASDVLGVIEEVRRNTGAFVEVAGIVADGEIDDRRFRDRGVRQIGGIEDLPKLDATHYIIAIGFSKARWRVFNRLEPGHLDAATFVHPRAFIPPNVLVGAGTIILAGVCVSPFARIGHHVYLSHGSLIGHDCDIRDFVTVLPGAAISGDTVLEETCMIGSNAVVVEGRSIGAGAIVGAGAVVLKDIPRDVTAAGVPAKWSISGSK
jgi:sugar O-acyltransferase (sialic acid O-acetyltransferase NeuD family)